jgi:hypothetical protein
MAQRLVRLLAATGDVNPGLECREGRLFLHNQPLAAHAERPQLMCPSEGCLPGHQHYRLLTPHAISNSANLQCAICQRREVYSTEQYMTSALQRYGLDQQAVLQWRPSWWRGRVDYYFPNCQVVMQVDGAAHFVANPRTRQLAELMQLDMAFNLAAWQAGAKLMRVHHEDQVDTPWLLQLLGMAQRGGPLLVLSPSFTRVRWQCDQAAGLWLDYVGHMIVLLGARACAAGGYVWLLPPVTL